MAKITNNLEKCLVERFQAETKNPSKPDQFQKLSFRTASERSTVFLKKDTYLPGVLATLGSYFGKMEFQKIKK